MSCEGSPYSTGRIEELDVLRGFAVLGILVANMAQYFLPGLLSEYAVSIRGDAVADSVSWVLIHAFVDNKFLTLFSILFGVSFALLTEKIAARRNGKPVLFRRILVLFIFGLIHGLFFYYADILLGYAVAAMLLWPMAAARPRTQLVAGLTLLLLITAPWRYLVSGPEADAAALPQTLTAAKLELSAALEREPADRSEIEESVDRGFSRPEIAAAWDEIQAYRVGPLAVSLPERLEHFLDILIVVAAYVLWRSLALFLIGAALYRSGWLTGNSAADWRRLSVRLLPIGIAANLIVSYLLYRDYLVPGQFTRALAVADELAALLLAAGYASLVFWTVRSGSIRWLSDRIASVGRTALSNYLGQSVVMSIVATHYGFSQFGQLSRTGMICLAAVFFVAQVAASHWWIHRFRFGPLEWLWRCSTYWTILPNRKPAS